jgi:hypothetical protein
MKNNLFKQNNMSKQSNLTNQKLNIFSIGYSHIIISIIIIFYVIIPILSKIGVNDPSIDLFKSYYVDNKYKSLSIDFFLIYIYLKSAELLPNNIPIYFRRLVIILFFDVILYYYINNTPWEVGTIKFLKEWSKVAGWMAIAWDILYIQSIGYFADKLNKFAFIQKESANLLIFVLLSFGLLHL